MVEAPESWDALADRVASTRFDDIRRFAEIDSTNSYLLAEARAGAPEGVVAVADHQSAGRGRAGRSWTAPPGSSLLVSILVRPPLAAEQAHLVTMAAGVAACEAVWMEAGFTPSLKWPNDLVVGDRKLAGMLSELDAAGGALAAVVVGIGLNVNWSEFPEEIAATATACNLEAGHPVDRVAVLARLLRRFDHWYGGLAEPGGPDSVLGEYRSRCSTVGRSVRVEMADGSAIEGVASAVGDDGRVEIEAAGRTHRVAVGDIVHLRSSGQT